MKWLEITLTSSQTPGCTSSRLAPVGGQEGKPGAKQWGATHGGEETRPVPVPAAKGGGAERGSRKYQALCEALPGTEVGEQSPAPVSTAHTTTPTSMACLDPQPQLCTPSDSPGSVPQAMFGGTAAAE